MSDNNRIRFYSYLYACLLLGFACLGCAQNEDIQIQYSSSGINPFELNQHDIEEIDLGNKIHNEITQRIAPYRHPTIKEYIDDLGFNLVRYVKRKNLPYQFTVLHDERIYATAAPGGYIYITTGMINFVDNEAELAAVIAHELARAQEREAISDDTRELLTSLSQGGMMIGPMFGPYGALAAMGLQALAIALNKEKNVDARTITADELALFYLTRADYDPQGLIDFVYKILYSNSKQRQFLYHYLTSHPITEDRIRRLNEAFSRLPLQGKAFDVNRERFLQIMSPVRKLYGIE